MNLAWDDALWALAALHIDPVGLHGIWLRAPHGPVRDEWLSLLQHLRPNVRRLPNNIDSERLLGGLDLSATLSTGRPVTQAGLLAQSDQSLLLAPMAERMANEAAAILGQVLDSGRVTPHGGGSGSQDARLGLIALDEALEDEPCMSESLQERLGIWLDLRHLGRQEAASDEILGLLGVLASPGDDAHTERQTVFERLRTLRLDNEQIQAITQMAQAMGIASLRGPLACVRLACVLAALRESEVVEDVDLGRAARLCLTPRATVMPAPPEQKAPPEQEAPEQPESTQEEPAPPDDKQPPDSPEEDMPPQDLGEMLLEAALASLPPDVLAQLASKRATQIKGGGQSRSGEVRQSRSRGSPLPPRLGLPRQGSRLHVLATLGHAAPRQKLRSPSAVAASTQALTPRLKIRAEDFHIHRFAERTQTCLIFAIDASGSAALHRLAEAKGAVELLLAQSYARRDQVCVVGFRGTRAEVLLPPTKSLVRAKRSLGGLPGGGGTPLPHAIKLALELALQQRRLGVSPSLVMLCDGRANVCLQGNGGRAQALQESLSWANAWRAQGLPSIWIDTSARPEPQAEQIARAMGSRYVPLPQANSQRMAQVVQAASR